MNHSPLFAVFYIQTYTYMCNIFHRVQLAVGVSLNINLSSMVNSGHLYATLTLFLPFFIKVNNMFDTTHPQPTQNTLLIHDTPPLSLPPVTLSGQMPYIICHTTDCNISYQQDMYTCSQTQHIKYCIPHLLITDYLPKLHICSY